MALAPSSPSNDINETPLETLRRQVRGVVITPADDGYAQARRIQNLTYDRFPDYVVMATCTDDVAAAVRFAREYRLPLSLRSGAHSVAGHSTNTGGVIIDVREMCQIAIDPGRRTARIQAGAKAEEVTAAVQEHGMILPLGDAASVGIAGLTLGGGIGWLTRKFGLTIDHLLSVDLVTADGQAITASETQHPDLFWALRGGGGNFGVATEFTFALQPLGMIHGGALVFPATAEVITRSIELARIATNDLTVIGYVMPAPPVPFLREEDHGKLVLILSAVYTGDAAQADEVFAPFRSMAEPLADILGPMPYIGMYDLTREATLPLRSSIRMTYADTLDNGTAQTIVEHMHQAPAPMSMFQYRVLGGRCAEISADATAYAHRDREVFLSYVGIWQEEGTDGANRQWTMNLWNAVRHAGTGTYSNFIEDEGESRIREAYPPATHDRLAQIKAAYDPENVFRLNQNIAPAAP